MSVEVGTFQLVCNAFPLLVLMNHQLLHRHNWENTGKGERDVVVEVHVFVSLRYCLMVTRLHFLLLGRSSIGRLGWVADLCVGKYIDFSATILI